MQRRLRFRLNLAILAGVWAFLNWPQNGGPLKRMWEWAGCPWTFASWSSGRLERFDPGALAADVAVGLAVAVPVAWLFARPRGSAAHTGTRAEPAAPGDRDSSSGS
ncbi:hypothetical protein R5W24_006489 [Gemmata sp. JC717]|uniref:hypothetical protein n=1 Tax=Gemmata algarum TaxID=2975278 RepID=UPI0021BB175B|nr:hypothetical protein [Gemmata algarum]MDY3557301.1 hypothetical protein [Gemmata algarum]